MRLETKIPKPLTRALVMGALVGGCARLADLGAGNASVAAALDAGPGGEGRTDANIDIAPAALDFGEVPCGTTPAAKLITLHNRGAVAVPYKAQVPAGSAFRIDGSLEGTLAPNGTVGLSVLANPQTAGDNVADLFVSAGDALQPIHATTKGKGPTLELGQSTIAFGDVRKENGAPAVDIGVKNSGTDTLTVTGFTSSNPAFQIEWTGKPGALTVAPGAAAAFKVSLLGAPADDAAALTATIKPEAKACGGPPVLTASGRRVTSDVTLNPADWGRQDCKTTPDPKDIVITNYANAAVNYSVIPSPNSAFTILDEGPHTVAAAPGTDKPQTASIRVAPKQLGGTAPLLDVHETLGVVLASTAPGVNGRRDVPLHVETRGAIITITPAALSFGSNGVKADSKSFVVGNTGNESIFLFWTLTRTTANGAGAWSYSSPSYVPAGGTSNGSVDFKAVEAGRSGATLVPAQPIFFDVASCQPFPALPLTGDKL